MEHLPPVENPYRPLFIPFLADHNASSFEFSDFQNPRGFNINSFLAGDLQGFSTDQIASFIQTWLYFGMIREVLDANIPTEEFVRTDKGGKWITTERLPHYMQLFRDQVEEERLLENMADIFEVRNTRIRTCFATARTYWLALVDLENNPLPEEAYFGIHVMANTLQVGATEICGLGRGYIYPLETSHQPGYREVPWEKDMHWRMTPNAFMERRMEEHGWCPVVSGQIQSTFNLLGQYYISLFQPPVRQLDHSQCKKSDKDCKGYWGFSGFGKHLTTDCQCETLEIDNVRLAEIVQKDEVPVLYFDEETKTFQVVSAESQPELEYVALSHVWSDGWGNPQKNSLSLCRIAQLVTWMKASYSVSDFKTQRDVGTFQRLADFQTQSKSGRWQRASSYSLPSSDGSWAPAPNRGYVGKLYFWMDTLCVPRGPKEIHNKAVMNMRNVYAQAERVLVLDAELLVSPAGASYEEINMRIQSSRWIRRLWTVQEAALARR
ncbi:het domain protein [Phlyctema vagabunda]|uniref:Het domain protein n=1 Tax=Phlyctema vagabunda TaxID=108571 RepID=A0ABR4PWN8_9HELO